MEITVTIPSLDNIVYVNDLSDLPEPVSGIITLADNTVYEFNSSTVDGGIDIGANRFAIPKNCVIKGQGTFVTTVNSSITDSNTLFTATETDGTFHIRDIMFVFPNGDYTLFDVQNQQQFLVDSAFFISNNAGGSLGKLENINTTLFKSLVSLVGYSQGLQLEGTLNTVFFSQTGCINIGGTPASNYIYTTPTTSIGVILQFEDAISFAPPGTNMIYVDPATSFGVVVGDPNQKLIIKGTTAVGGGSILSGITLDDNRVFSRNNLGLADNKPYASFYFTSKDYTTPDSIGVPLKALGNTTLRYGFGFSHADNQLTYDLSTPSKVHITASALIVPTGTGTNSVSLYIAKNGTVDETSKTRLSTTIDGTFAYTDAVFDVSQGDYFEMWVANETDTDKVIVDNNQSKLTITAI